MGKCNLDSAGVALKVLYGDDMIKGVAVPANLKSFDQTAYIKGVGTGLGSTGYIYTPASCAAGAVCKLHVSFHGCLQAIETVGNVYATQSGYNDWAEANNIIVLYPYAKPSTSAPSNPNGCFDWWAYTDKNYALKTGVQMSFAKRLIDAVTGGSLVPETVTPTQMPVAAPTNGVPTIYPTQVAPTNNVPTIYPTQEVPTDTRPTVYPTQATPTDPNAPTMFPTQAHPTLFPIAPSQYPTAIPPTMYPTETTPTLTLKSGLRGI